MELYDQHHRVVLQDHNLFHASTDEHFKKEPQSQGLHQWFNTGNLYCSQVFKKAPGKAPIKCMI